MRQFEFGVRYFSDQAKSLFRNRWLLSFIRLHIARRLKSFAPDVYVISYPKSGRTWLRMILISYFSNLQNHGRINYSILEEIDDGRVIVFKHAQGTWRPIPLRIERASKSITRYAGKRIILLVRDPRDTLVSNWYHLKHRYDIYRKDLSHFIREELLGIDKIIAFMNLWLDNKDIFEDFLLIRYEDLRVDSEATARKVLRFLGEKDINAGSLKRAMDYSSFENMQRMEAEAVHENPWAVPSNPKDKRTFKARMGLVGDWKNHFSEPDMALLNGKIDADLRKEFGY